MKEEIKIRHAPTQMLDLATAPSRTAKKWKNVSLSWGELVARLSNPTITQETLEEYQAMSVADKGRAKDVGGFVGGHLKEGRRKNGNVRSRSLVALDADSPVEDFMDLLDISVDYAYVLYSTHSHTTEKPKYRMIIPTNRAMAPDEYEPVARYLADQLGMENFDDTTYQDSRLMYWPSHARGADFVFRLNDEEFLDVDEVLGTYADWKDSSLWPQSLNHGVRQKREAKKQGDPLDKPGLVGAFCKIYDIEAAIAEFLSDIYVEGSIPGRYTYVHGSTANGLVIYDDKFAYSHHGTDPVGDTLVNSYDLVRIHQFGDLDLDAKEGTPTNKLPSSKAMNAWVRDLDSVSKLLVDESIGDFDDDFETAEGVEDKRDWIKPDERGEMEINSYLLAQQILREVPIWYDGFEFLRYDASKGIWIGSAEDYLKSYISTKKLNQLTKIRHLNETLVAIKALAYSQDTFEESDISKIVLANGVYDFKENSFTTSFSPELHARSSHPIEYDGGATCPAFEGFLEETLGAENVDFVFEWFGYNFYREYNIQKMLFIHGKGGTGKSTIINVLRAMLGADNYAAVTLQYLMQERFAKIGLYRKVANFDTDAKPQYLADGATLKMLTGEDTIHADRKNKEPITFYNYAKLTFAMNELPPMRDFSGGLKRRMLILEMNKVLTKDIKEKYPLITIMAELPGIFNRAMEGLRRALGRRDFVLSASMKESVEKWERGNDVVALFIEDECILGEDKRSAVTSVYTAYRQYCLDSGYKPLARNSFNSRMEELGFERKSAKIGGKVAKVWSGFSLEDEFQG